MGGETWIKKRWSNETRGLRRARTITPIPQAFTECQKYSDRTKSLQKFDTKQRAKFDPLLTFRRRRDILKSRRKVERMILVTGASGRVGGEALRTLLLRRFPAIGMVRSPDNIAGLPPGTPLRVANYEDRKSLMRAFEGISTLLFISSDGNGRDVLRHHANVVEAAVSQRISSVVFTSIIDVDAASPFYYAPVYRDAERRLQEKAPAWTILRCGLYSDFVLDYWIKPAFPTGVLSLPVRERKIAPISTSDVAMAAAAVASSPMPHTRNIYELTGHQLLSFHEIAKAAASAFGRPVDFIPCSPADYLQHAWAELDDPWPHAFSTLCQSIAEGRYERTSSVYEHLVGRPPTEFERFVRVAARSQGWL
jgi:NAD(P)H dehydrogenase (quinone)